jgi:hypothetical protein
MNGVCLFTVLTGSCNINNFETRLGEQRSFDIPENEASRQYREETDTIHEALRNIAEAVINDADELHHLSSFSEIHCDPYLR